MLIFLRRFLVLSALMFWQGGFLFYTAVVVPVGQQVLGSPLEQGFITRRVTIYLNLGGEKGWIEEGEERNKKVPALTASASPSHRSGHPPGQG